MKNLSKCLFIAVICLLSVQSFAQKYGVVGGFNLANMLMKDDDGTYSDDFKMKPGFHAGVLVNFPATEVLSIESGLLMDMKGTKMEDVFEGVGEVKLTTYYLDIPVTLKASQELSEGLKLYGKFGPYIGVGLSGKMKAEASYMGESMSEEEDIKWGSGDDDDLKRLDYGLTAGVGVEIKQISIGVNYDLGLANISSYTEDGSKMKNKLLKFSVAYWFGE